MNTASSDQHDNAEKSASAEAPLHKSGTPTDKPDRKKVRLIRVLSRLAGILVLLVLAAGMVAYAASPAPIRQPGVQHYHLRLQIIADGKPVNFATAAFQEGYSKDNCSGDLTAHPFHFHDNRDQMAHVHWDDMTGGLLLKYYGWNYTGGIKDTLGYRFDTFPKVQRVPIYRHALPKLANDDKFYVYTGDENGYQERSWNDFLKQDFETFFDKKSNLEGDQSSWLTKLFPKAYAHGTEAHGADGEHFSQEQLTSINNLLGNVVIFAGQKEPTSSQVKERFNNLVPLEASTCGG